jgi:mannose-6-phosphate isomerase
MADRLGKRIPDGPVGESWEVSAHPNGVSRAADGPLTGMSLAEIAAKHGPALLGEKTHAAYRGEFPVLVKLIDVNALASVQVHPDDAQAQRLEGYPRGKTEAWYIVSREPAARFHLGLVDGVTPDRFRRALAEGTVRDLLASPQVSAGDCLFVPPGTVHACGQGVLLLEVQQSCDITYRVYDWDRVDEKGNRRELHVEKALQVIDWGARPSVLHPAQEPDALVPILSCTSFDMHRAAVEAGLEVPPLPLCRTGTVVEGRCMLAGAEARLELACGDSFVAPAGAGFSLQAGPAAVVITTMR